MLVSHACKGMGCTGALQPPRLHSSKIADNSKEIEGLKALPSEFLPDVQPKE